MTPLDICLDYLARFIGTPYAWGGNDPIAGFDCSGLMVEVLQAVGILPRRGDWSATGLRELFAGRAPVRDQRDLRPGMLVFWPSSDGGGRMRHVEMIWRVLDDGTVLTIGASGGGSATTTLADAVRQDAYVKVRPIAPGWTLAVDPLGPR
jgi:hypothetical protein